MSLVIMSVEPSSWPQGDCMGCSCDGGVGNILDSSADAKMLTPPAVKCWPPSVVMPPPGEGCAGAIRNLLPIRAVSSGMPDGLFDPGGVGTGHCIQRDTERIIEMAIYFESSSSSVALLTVSFDSSELSKILSRS